MKTTTRIGMLANLKLEKRDVDKRLKILWDEIRAVYDAIEAKEKPEGLTPKQQRLMWDHWHTMNAYAAVIEKRIKHLISLRNRQRRKK